MLDVCDSDATVPDGAPPVDIPRSCACSHARSLSTSNVQSLPSLAAPGIKPRAAIACTVRGFNPNIEAAIGIVIRFMVSPWEPGAECSCQSAGGDRTAMGSAIADDAGGAEQHRVAKGYRASATSCQCLGYLARINPVQGSDLGLGKVRVGGKGGADLGSKVRVHRG